jgi:hypothetical protein
MQLEELTRAMLEAWGSSGSTVLVHPGHKAQDAVAKTLMG